MSTTKKIKFNGGQRVNRPRRIRKVVEVREVVKEVPVYVPTETKELQPSIEMPVPPNASMLEIRPGDYSQLIEIRDLYDRYLRIKNSLEAKAEVWFYQNDEIYAEIQEAIAKCTVMMKELDGVRTRIVFPKSRT